MSDLNEGHTQHPTSRQYSRSVVDGDWGPATIPCTSGCAEHRGVKQIFSGWYRLCGQG